jgi:predicted RNase H-like HicB family nuclease
MSRYSSVVRWSDNDDAYIAVCPELGGISAFGDTPEEAISELGVAVGLAIETYEEEGWPLPEPAVVEEFSGQFRVRLPRSLHALLAHQAELEGVSQNSLVVAYIAASLKQAEIEKKVENALDQMQESILALGGTVYPLSAESANAVQRRKKAS